MERDNRLAHYFALFWGLGLILGYLTTSDAKSDVTFLPGDPDFLGRRRNFPPISLSFRDMTRDRQTTDTATVLEVSYIYCVQPNNPNWDKLYLKYFNIRKPQIPQ